MARNIELKARCADLAGAAEAARGVGARRSGEMFQLDTYFNVRRGRLKLREIDQQNAELIWYARPNETGFRPSDYTIVPVTAANEMKAALSAALGVRVEVRKRRELWLWENVRIHLDDVERLGTFVEFEAVVCDSSGETISRERVERLRGALKIRAQDCIAGSYSDLLEP